MDGPTRRATESLICRRKASFLSEIWLSIGPTGTICPTRMLAILGWIRALDNIANLHLKTVIPAHGDLGDVDLLRRQREFISDMWKQVKQGLKAGKSPAELKKTLQFTQHGIFARDPRETEDMVESMCERARTQPDWNSGPGESE